MQGVYSKGKQVTTMPRRTSSSSSASLARGTRPAKTPNVVAPASPSPDSSSDNASDNSDLFPWPTTIDTATVSLLSVRNPVSSAPSSSASATTAIAGGVLPASSSASNLASLTASRKRKLLEQFLVPDGEVPELRSGTPAIRPMQPPPPPPVSLSSRGAVQPVTTYVTFPIEPVFSSQYQMPLASTSGLGADNSANGSTESLASTVDSISVHDPLHIDEVEVSAEHVHLNRHPSDAKDAHGHDTSTGGGSCANRVNTWPIGDSEDIDDNLAADFDGSLSGLGVDLSVASYNMSEALLALPSLTVFKQEAASPNYDNGRPGAHPSGIQNMVRSQTHSFHQLLQQQASGTNVNGHTAESGRVGGEGGTGSVSSLTSSSSNEALGGSGPTPSTPTSRGNTMDKYSKYERLNEADVNADNRFLYVLSASTSIASKVNEETLTYLNQGQSYEIKLKKLGDLSNFRGKYLKSVVRLCFHERRLQYMEREQIAAWRQTRPGDRIVEVDIPLSYGIYDVVQDLQLLNVVEFVWDPTKEVGVYVKINCIGTEFTPKKHGGEKGVPFRLQVETYAHGEDCSTPKRLHVAACQIKVFKLKGADRKHKQDKEKLMKRPLSEQEKYQPSCVCTVLSEVPLDSVYTTVSAPPTTTSIPTPVTTVSTAVTTNSSSATRHYSGEFLNETCNESSPTVIDTDGHDSPNSLFSGNPSLYQFYMQPLPVDATAQQTAQWLQSNRFQSLTRTFAHFAGPDILRLSRDDLIQICGLADGIRLFNALHAKAPTPRLTLYLSYVDSQPSAFHAIYLESLTSMELVSKIAALVQGGSSSDTSLALYTQGPSGIHVIVTDEVVHNLKDESIWTLEVIQSDDGDMFRVLLKPAHTPEM